MDFQSAMETFAEAWVAANSLPDSCDSQGGTVDKPPGESPDCGTDFRPVRSIPIHTVVEQVAPVAAEPPHFSVEVDSYAIVPTGAPFSDLVRTALIKLGYSASEVAGAKGAIQLKNWKPLTFDQITEVAETTVGDILGDLTGVATLKIRLYSRPKVNSANEVKEKLLQVLLAQSQSLLINSGCPIDQSLLAALTKGRIECDIPEEVRKKFDQWYLQQIFQHCRQVALLQQQQHHFHHQQPATPQLPTSEEVPPRIHPGRTRIRTSFDPEMELPKLHRWFAENQHPTRLQIQQYVKELNSLESRRGRKPLDLNNVVYWFKNARAAHKRAEQKGCLESNGSGIGVQGEATGSRPGSYHSDQSTSSAEDSDHGHTLDLSIRRLNGESPVSVKAEPRIESDELESSGESGGEEDIDVTSDKPENGSSGLHLSVSSMDPDQVGSSLLEERRKRNRTFIDPVTEVPRLEHWFASNTHPAHSQIVRYTQELNIMPYRQKFPKLEPKNIQFWFKNRRAKCKRLNLAALQADNKMILN